MSKLFHNSFDLFLALNFNFVLFIDLIHSLSKDFEYWGAAFAPLIKEFDIVNGRLLKFLNDLSCLLIDLFIWVSYIHTCLQASFLHQHVDLEK